MVLQPYKTIRLFMETMCFIFLLLRRRARKLLDGAGAYGVI